MTKSVSKPTDYAEFLATIKSRIRDARIAAFHVVNRGLVNLCWTIGRDIVEKQKRHEWGEAVVEQLLRDLRKEFPGTTGFSSRNLWNMKRCYEEYEGNPILQQLVAELPWGQNLLIMEKVANRDAEDEEE